MDELQLLRRRLEREKQARRAAELFIEEKSLELYVEQQKREQAFQALQAQTVATNTLNRQLQEEISRRIQAETLESFLERIVQDHPLHSILVELTRMVEAQTPGGRCFIAVHADGELFHADRPLSEGRNPVIQAPLAWLPGGAHEQRQIQWVDDVSRHPVWRRHAESGPLGTGSAWSVPLTTAHGEHIGEFALQSPGGRPPSESDLEWMMMISGLAALAIGHRQLADNLNHQAHHDALTDLPNRFLFRDRLNQAIAHARREDHRVGVLFLDLDGFKYINDTLGHQQGDNVLMAATRRIRRLLRETDTLARMGGDEFTLILPGMKSVADATRMADRCLETLRRPIPVDGHELYVTASIGIALFPDDARDAEQLQRNADAAMYRAKARGKNCFEFFTPELTAGSRERLDLRADLHHALEEGQLALHYQPQYRADGVLSGFEALMRWNHPRHGAIPPGTFIPIAEESGLILAIGQWALEHACQQMAQWQRRGVSRLLMAVNLSAVQLQQEDWTRTVARVLEATGLPASSLELELTESLVMQDVQSTARHLRELRALGVRVAIDDFGTGYSSLNYLRQLLVDTLKIDRSFISEIDAAAEPGLHYPIIRSIIELGHSLGLSLIAEGVETEHQARTLRDLGCDGLQGHLFAPPMTANDCETLLRQLRALP
ncbi:putative bifunctional diguanylate cyclase/phosphodiesterase [Pseudoxanthomonas beigongshangi]